MKLQKWIEKENKTNKQVAEDTGISEMNISRYASGQNIPRPDNLQKIVAYTGGEVQANDFYEGE